MQREVRRKERAERDLRNARAEIDTNEAEIRLVTGPEGFLNLQGLVQSSNLFCISSAQFSWLSQFTLKSFCVL